MPNAPTRGAVDRVRAGWTERPAIALAIRIILFALPILSGWLAVRLLKSFFWQPPGLSGLLIWVLQAIVVAGVASFVATKLVRRLLPLAALFQLTLVFPDHAPSRLGIALRGGTVKKMKANLELTGDSHQIAAEQALELIAQLGRHERLTRGHTERVRARAEMIGVEMGLKESEINLLRWGVLLHDIGKLGVPPEILNKESKLTDDEWAIMREHPAIGAEIVAPLSGWLGDWVHAAGQHHERWDGGGYPDGLAGTDISLAGRITAVADAYDVITSKRSYKEAMTDEAARRELVRCSGDQFDPVVVRAALQVGLRGAQRSGLASWLFELPSIARFLTAVPSVATAAAIAVAASVSAPVPASNPPEAVAMSAETPVVEEPPAEATVVATSDPPAVIVTTSTVSRVSVPEVSTTSAATVAPAVTTTTSSQATTETVVAPTVTTTQVPVTTTAVPTTTTATTAVPTTTTTTTAPTTTTTTAAPTTTTTTTAVPTTTTTTTAVPTTTTTTAAPTTTTTTTPTTSTTTTTIAPEPPPVGPEPLPLPQTTPIVVLRRAEVPDDLTLAAQPTLMSRSRVFIIEEDQFVTLGEPLDLYYDERSFRASSREPNVVIEAGTTVCSWLVRYETLTEGLNSQVAPKIDFQSQILGIAFLSRELRATSELALDGVVYSFAGLEQSDRVQIAGSTISFSWTAGNASIDQVRVVTDCSTP